jgi:O-antigen biosynthesis protein
MTATLFACCLFFQSVTPEVIEHSQAGIAAAQQGRLDVAIREFRKVTELQPNSAVGHAHLGDAYFRNGDYSAAIPELEAALRLSPNIVDPHQTLGVILLMQGDAEGALPHLEKMRTPELLGLAYLETGRLGGAIAALREALNRQPHDLNALYYFGRATALAAKRSSDQLLHVNSGLPRKSSGDGQEEGPPLQDLVTLQDALAKRPNDADLLSAFSRAAAKASEQAFNQILQSDPKSARAHQVLAERDADSGHLREAEREYTESLRLKPNTSNVHLALGNVFAAQDNWSAAAVQYRMETQLQPLNADAFYHLGSVLLQQGQAGDAVQELTHADSIKPNTPQILMVLATAALTAHDNARAEGSWTKLLAIDKSSPLAAAAHMGLSALYRSTGKSKEADRELAAYEQLKKQAGH